MRDRKESFVEKLYECNQHKRWLLEARGSLSDIMPLDVVRYRDLEYPKMSVIDQMIFRFSRLQDTMGEKLFPEILYLNAENVKKMSFIDRLNRLEELELVNKEEWMRLRKYRNEVAHEYSFNQKEVVDGINTIYEKAELLLRIYSVIYNYSFEKFEFVREAVRAQACSLEPGKGGGIFSIPGSGFRKKPLRSLRKTKCETQTTKNEKRNYIPRQIPGNQIPLDRTPVYWII